MSTTISAKVFSADRRSSQSSYLAGESRRGPPGDGWPQDRVKKSAAHALVSVKKCSALRVRTILCLERGRRHPTRPLCKVP